MIQKETQSKKTVSREEIDALIVENIGNIVTQQTGVVTADNEVNIRGGRSYENAFLLDGVSVQDPLSGTGFGLQLSASAIEEVEVITGGFNAEFGQATSGVVNVRTREGSEKYSGSITYKRDNLGDKSSPYVFNIDILEANLSGPAPITSLLLPALGLNIPGRLAFFGNFYSGISDGITQGYYKPPADQLYSSTFNGTRFAPRTENSWFWLLKFTYFYSPTLKFNYSFNQSVNINQNSQSLQSNLEYIEPSPGYQYSFQNILDNANTFHYILSERPELLVSGINRGANLGNDVNYSGTVAAALEGARMGIPAFAVSLSAPGAHCQYEPSARFALRLARAILQGGLPPHTMLNVNVPDTRGKVIEGYRLTTLGNQDCRNTIEEKCDPRGMRYYWIGRRETVSAPRETDHLSDYRALEENCISVTPLSLDRTHHGYVQKLARWML